MTRAQQNSHKLGNAMRAYYIAKEHHLMADRRDGKPRRSFGSTQTHEGLMRRIGRCQLRILEGGAN